MENTRDRDIQDITVELCEACSDGNIEVVEEILSNEEVNINDTDYGCETPLMCAVEFGHLDIVRRLLQHPETQLEGYGFMGYTALHVACIYNKVSIVKLLCQDRRCSPSFVNKKNNNGYAPLMYAVRYGYLDIVKELDMEGSDFFTKDRDGISLIEVARFNNKAEVLDYLTKRIKVDNLKVIAAHNVASFLKNKGDVGALEIPETLRHFLAGFVDNEDSPNTDDDGDDDDD